MTPIVTKKAPGRAMRTGAFSRLARVAYQIFTRRSGGRYILSPGRTLKAS
jgi:hypothetical protein